MAALLALLLWPVAGSRAAEASRTDGVVTVQDEGQTPPEPGEAPDEPPTAQEPVSDEPPSEAGAEPTSTANMFGSVPPPPTPGKKRPEPWKLLFFDNDFSYKKDPQHQWLFGEDLKDIRLDETGFLGFLPEPTRFSTGGEVRFRQMDESNRLRVGPPGSGDYQLWRWRHYVDVNFSDTFRVYAEMIDASMDNNSLPVTGIDVNRWDVQNLFFDLRFAEFDDRPVWFRFGRQELLYGSQRLVSPLDWANTRRNFEGFKFFTKQTDWDFDLWFTRPVNTATFGDGPLAQALVHFDSPNMNHTFSGAWFTWKKVKDQIVDLYWLWDRNTQFLQPHYPRGNRHTLATRWLRHFPDENDDHIWHGEVEGGYQFGDDFGKDVNAGFVVGGVGHTWRKAPWEPDLWFYYDWASGSNNLNGSTTNTFAQQYGLVHAFLGQIDNIARQNISDINGKFTVKPTDKLVCQAQYHWFDLANNNDVLYIITGQPFGKPHSGRHVGDELDLVATYVVNPNFNIQVGYFWFWYGQYVEANSPRGNAREFYIQTTFSY